MKISKDLKIYGSNMNIAEKLILLRKERGLTQEDVSKIFDISLTAVRNYENVSNIRIPKNEILIKMAKFYDVDLEYLLDDNVINKKHNNIIIEKELGLKDESIENIQKIKEDGLCNELNSILSDEEFWIVLDYYKVLREQKTLIKYAEFDLYIDYDYENDKFVRRKENLVLSMPNKIYSEFKKFEQKNFFNKIELYEIKEYVENYQNKLNILKEYFNNLEEKMNINFNIVTNDIKKFHLIYNKYKKNKNNEIELVSIINNIKLDSDDEIYMGIYNNINYNFYLASKINNSILDKKILDKDYKIILETIKSLQFKNK